MQPATAVPKAVPGTPPPPTAQGAATTPPAGGKRPGQPTGQTPLAKRPGLPATAMQDVGEPSHRSNAELTRALLALEGRIGAMEKWIPTNNEVLEDHAIKIDQLKSRVGGIFAFEELEAAEMMNKVKEHEDNPAYAAV